jgi:nicotinamide mononucleotide transporter
MHICGLFLWYRTTSRRTFEVIHRNLDGWGKFTVVFLIAVFTFLLGDVLRLWGDELPYIDAFTTVASVHAAWLMVNRYAEQWSLFIIINVVSIFMWLYRWADDGGSVGMVVMWIIWTINSIYGCIKWNKT